MIPCSRQTVPQESITSTNILRVNRTDWAVVVVLLLLGTFEIAAVERVENFGGDSSTYITLANNILHTHRYEFNFQPHTTLPPGFPLLLAGISAALGSASYSALISFMPLFSTAGFIVWYFLLRMAWGRAVASASCLLVATSAPLFELVTQWVLSEPVFLLSTGLALGSLMLLDRSRRASGWSFFGAIFFTVASVAIRSAGIALCIGIAVWALAAFARRDPKKGFSRAFVALAGFVAFSCWITWSTNAKRIEYQGEYMKTYVTQFGMKDPHRPELGKATVAELVPRIRGNVPTQASRLAAILTRVSWIAPVWYMPLTVILLALLAIGLAFCACNHRGTLLAAYFAAYFAVYTLWPFDEGARFMLPVAPVAVALVWEGFTAALQSLRTRPVATLATLFAFAAVITAGALNSRAGMAGLQVRASLAFWPAATLVLLFLILLAKGAGETKTAIALDSVGRLTPLATALVALLCIAGFVEQAGLAQANLNPDPTLFRHYPSADCAAWLGTTLDGAVMAEDSEKAILHSLSGRRIVAFPITSNPRIIVDAARRGAVRYLVVNDHVSNPYYLPDEEERYARVERAYPGLLVLVHQGPRYRVFEFQREVTLARPPLPAGLK